MRWVRPVSARVAETPDVLGAKAHGLVLLHRLGLPVPAGFVVTTSACREFLRTGSFPTGLAEELRAATADLETRTGRRFGGGDRPLAVSVRSGAGVSMPGMMSTVLNLGLTIEATAALAAETGDPRFATASRRRFLSSFASALTGTDVDIPPADTPPVNTGAAIPDAAADQLTLAVRTVFSSWNTPRARTYRRLHGIADDLGTAAIVQMMVFGNRDGRSGTGVAFSRDPNTGENVPFGDVLFERQGEDVVSGRAPTLALRALADREPAVWAGLLDALRRIEDHYRDACYVEFTFQAGELWFLQVRPGRFTGAATVRVATDLADEGVLTRGEALLRVSPHHLEHARTLRIVAAPDVDVLTRGVGACPGVAAGRIATTTDAAVRMAADGPVILVRPETSPHDMRGLAAATGVLTARGGPASHAAVVARTMGKPAVVGAVDLTVDGTSIRVGGRILGEGTTITIDGTSGEVALGRPRAATGAAGAHLHRLLAWADDASGDRSAREEAQRLRDAHAALRRD
ncbi:pyruvate, phosphate dikinase [Microtetraspora malaysiensis]|uniref:pyruvate, phosphate dikinase n=1 Tax=Microtetraspora malaysiensis TaxID=161358 RepID=UPI003D89F5E0